MCGDGVGVERLTTERLDVVVVRATLFEDGSAERHRVEHVAGTQADGWFRRGGAGYGIVDGVGCRRRCAAAAPGGQRAAARKQRTSSAGSARASALHLILCVLWAALLRGIIATRRCIVTICF